MNEKYPYEDRMKQAFDDLPLPDRKEAWERMEKLLDQKDSRRRFLPPLQFRSCLGPGLLLLAIFAAGWFLLKPAGWWKEEKVLTGLPVVESTPSKENREPRKHPAMAPPVMENGSAEKTDATGQIRDQIQANSRISPVMAGNTGKPARVQHASGIVSPRGRPGTGKELSAENVQGNPVTVIAEPVSEDIRPATPVPDAVKTSPDSAGTGEFDLPVISPPAGIVDSAKRQDLPEVIADSSVVRKEAFQGKTSRYYLSAGVGMQQQIPVAGQIAVPYDYYGRKNSLYDYIPSVYLRLHRGRKWFIQGEFRYGAPQSLEEFSFTRKTVMDTSATKITTTSTRLKKTYYHQIPLTFNHYIVSGWSVGAGAMYSRFHGAVTERETRIYDVQSQQETMAKSIVPLPGFTDSFLYKTQLHLLLQSDFSWKRISLGIRYKMDMQPFIKYTRPDGEIRTERNEMLELMLRFRLWQSVSPR